MILALPARHRYTFCTWNLDRIIYDAWIYTERMQCAVCSAQPDESSGTFSLARTHHCARFIAPTGFVQVLWNLGRLSAPGLSDDDDHLVYVRSIDKSS